MSKHIIDYLDKIDETLLEDALCIPEQPYEVVLDAGKHYTRGSMLRTAALAASLAAAVTFAATGTMYNRSGFSPNQSSSSPEASGSVSGGILIPTEFSQADLEAQHIVEEKYLSAKNVIRDRFTCQSYEDISFNSFVFPQINEPLPSQVGQYTYFLRNNLPKETVRESIAKSFTREATELYMKQYGVGTITSYNGGAAGKIELYSGGLYDKDGYLTEPPVIIQTDYSYYMTANPSMKEFMPGAFIGTISEVSRTDNELIFSYIRSDPSGQTLMEERGRMVLQNGSWLFSWYEGWIF